MKAPGMLEWLSRVSRMATIHRLSELRKLGVPHSLPHQTSVPSQLCDQEEAWGPCPSFLRQRGHTYQQPLHGFFHKHLQPSQSFPQLLLYYFIDGSRGEGNGNPLQCSCLENPRDGGAWWAAVYGVAQSRTGLKRLSSSSSSSSSRWIQEGIFPLYSPFSGWL